MFTVIFMLACGWVFITNLLDIAAGLIGFKGLEAFVGYWGAMFFLVLLFDALL